MMVQGISPVLIWAINVAYVARSGDSALVVIIPFGGHEGRIKVGF